ncbi:MAG: cysteine desulfurase [Coriobacteriia bacterium]|nr:cysteine desulfurase [Coriobacteriia bacterium]
MPDVYLDFNASTPIAPEVRDAMLPYLETAYGNPSSTHWAGRAAREVVEKAREQVAGLLGCSAGEVVFTGGGTEANNHALKGAFYANGASGHIITTAVEHPAVIEPCRFLERIGAEVTVVPVDSNGRVDPGDIEAAIRPDTIVVSVMHANNEVGTIQPIREIARVCRPAEVLFHTDAAQSVGKIATRVDELGVDLLSIAAHKFYGPKGVGALYIREGVALEPLMHGAGHEGGRRAGTENVLLDAGLGAAATLAKDLAPAKRMLELREHFWRRLREEFGDGVVLNGHPEHRLPNTLNVSFTGRVGADILAAMPEVAATTGSACHSGAVKMSPVLAAMGTPEVVAAGAIRFSLGRMTTVEEIEHVSNRLVRVVS